MGKQAAVIRRAHEETWSNFASLGTGYAYVSYVADFEEELHVDDGICLDELNEKFSILFYYTRELRGEKLVTIPFHYAPPSEPHFIQVLTCIHISTKTHLQCLYTSQVEFF